MNIFSPLDLIRSHQWSHSFFTTYALSLSFFEAVVLDALIRQNVERTVILADISGVRAALAEYGSRCAGRVYEIEPVAVEHGCFHPKLVALTSSTKAHLLVGSGNLTFGGWGSNLECVEHLHPGVAADAFDDAADFLESLATVSWVKHDALEPCVTLAAELRQLASAGARTGNIRLLHSLDRPIVEQLTEIAEELGGAKRLTMASPFYDGVALDQLCGRLGLDHAFVHSHDGGTVAGSFGANWPVGTKAKVDPVEINLLKEDARPLHAKAFEIVCRQGRVVLSGSANATMAALDRERNVELGVVRIHRDTVTSWGLETSFAPAIAEHDIEEEENHATEGVLRAVLKGDAVRGWILTPFPVGNAAVSRLTASGPIAVGETLVTGEGRFTLVARDIEREAWTAQRLILRVTSLTGTVASGFASFADFAEIKRHLGSVSSRLFAMLAGTETPDDVAAVMSWFHEHPEYLSQHPAGGGVPRCPQTSNEVTVSSLLNPDAVEAAVSGPIDVSETTAWRRFIDLVLASFRQTRGPITVEGRSEEDAPPEDEPEDENSPEPTRGAPSLDRPLNFFEKLLDLMLSGSSSKRGGAFWLTHYVCDRLEPDAVRVKSYLDKLIAAFGNQPPAAADREAVSAAILVWAAQLPTDIDPSALLRITRRKLLRMGADVAGPAPDINLIQGFARILAADFDFAAFWENIRSIRTPQEEVKSFRLAGAGAKLDAAAFPYLANTPELSKITASERKRLKFMTKYAPSCPCCYLALPLGQASRLREAGIARALSCCGRILLCEEI